MDGEAIAFLNTTDAVDVLADYVEYTATDLLPGGHSNGLTGGDDFLTAGKAVSRVHGDGTNGVFPNVLLGFHDDFLAIGAHYHQGIVNLGKHSAFKVHVDNGTDDLGNFSFQSGHNEGIKKSF